MNGDGTGYTRTWQAAPAEPFGERQPAEGEIHVWRATLDLPRDRVGELERFLAADELGRAKRFLVRSAQDRYTVARAVLRNLLSRYVSAAPADLRFHYTEYGKPELAHRRLLSGSTYPIPTAWPYTRSRRACRWGSTWSTCVAARPWTG